ncbi:hypothetical protein CVV65_10585 [Kyrpidia spormannii]|uniref:Uncharacterized protein n=1 Tax=Kyrpidia spormannii TaxID=2055160 RepID=A0A2K8N7P5_9BACL|nr:hypothetical protein [Kyrpidia spormannii]ATY85313.1 hypothetical protein CVV65_10585 [Kyrpidia spormannii]
MMVSQRLQNQIFSEGAGPDVKIIPIESVDKEVIMDPEYFEELLRYKEVVEQVMDEEMVRLAAERKDDAADIPLDRVIGDNFGFDEIKAEMDRIGVDDEE